MTRASGPVAGRLAVATAAWFVLTLLASLGATGPARAACGPGEPLELAIPTAQVVFVGTVTGTTNAGRYATVRVEERWRGADLGETVEVRGGSEPGTATSNDRAYGLARYLFVVREGPGWLIDDACTPTTAWTDELARHRPPNVQPNLTGGPGEAPTLTFGTVAPVVALAVALVIVVVAYLTIIRARRRPPDWVR